MHQEEKMVEALKPQWQVDGPSLNGYYYCFNVTKMSPSDVVTLQCVCSNNIKAKQRRINLNDQPF